MNNNSKRILIVIDSYERFVFFKRFSNALDILDCKAYIISALPTLHFFFEKHHFSSILCNPTSTPSTHHIENCLEYATQAISEKLAIRIYDAFYKSASKAIDTYKITHCIMWNGSRTQTRAVTKACTENEVKTLFLEIANLPGKLFVDPQGTNSHSKFYQSKATIQKSVLTNQEFDTWRTTFIESKLQAHTVAQAKKAKSLKLEYSLDYLLWLMRVGQRLVPLGTPLKNIIKINKKQRHQYQQHQLNQPFVFLPLQVSNDSQIFFHSDIDNFDAIENAVTYAKQRKLALIIKPHPAEPNPVFLSKIWESQEEHGYKISKQNTFQLIKNCEKLFVINSSVAIEALIMGKEVEILGKSIFKCLDKTNLNDFIFGHLVEIDYFGSEQINETLTTKLFKYFDY